jgi:hypothetical protein
MQTYGEFRPTQFDAAGLGLSEQQNWFVLPVSQTRDSGELDKSNFAVALEQLGGESETVQVHRFGHWGPGWYEIIIVDPADVERVKTAEGIESSLADYPVLSDEDVSRREWNAYTNTWQHRAGYEFAQELQRVHKLSDAAFNLIDDASPEAQQTFFESLIPSGDYYDPESCYPRIDYAAKAVDREEIAAFLRAQRNHKTARV